MSPGREERERPPDVEIGAAASARRIRFRQTPETEVRFGGHVEHSESQTTRENLPDQVEPGVTYRDVRVEWHAGARAASETESLHEKES